MVEESAWTGVQALLDEYVGADVDDVFVIAYEPKSRDPAAWVLVALESRGLHVNWIPMRPLRDVEFGNRLELCLPKPEELKGRLIIITLERDTLSHQSVLLAAVGRFPPNSVRIFRIISACEALFSTALRALPKDLSSYNASVFDYCSGSNKLLVTSRAGTEFTVGLNFEKHRWISNRGVWRSGSTVILPAGEVATYPASIDGVLVADFAFNLNAITDRDARLQTNPVTVWIERGEAVRIHCNDASTSKFIDECFSRYNANKVGEIGFGTNRFVDNAIELNSHVNERRPGVHLGFGQHNQDPNIVQYNCDVHLDLIARGGVIKACNKGKSLDLEQFVPWMVDHPGHTRDEDVFSPEVADLEIDDCCGILDSDGLKLFEPSHR